MNNLLLTGAYNFTKSQIKKISDIGYEVTFVQDERKKLSIDMSVFDIVVCNNLFIHNDIKDFKRLKTIQLTSAGFDRIPLEYIYKNNIKVFNAKGIYSAPISEWVISKILDVYKKNNIFLKQQHNKVWKKHRNLRELSNKNAAIIGYGDIGKEIAKKLKAFDVKIFAFDHKLIMDNILYKYVDINELEFYLHILDIVILTLPLTKSTYLLFNSKLLSLLKKDAVFVNVSRGEIIDEDALIDLLIKRKDLTAILDVFVLEPLNKSSLWDLENVVISPHNSYASEFNRVRLFNLIKNNLTSLITET